MTRHRISLDGPWEFQYDASGELAPHQVAPDRTAMVPMPWQAQFDDLRHASGVGWYRRRFWLDDSPRGAAVLHFGAVDYHATAWLNGKRLGEHEGGYLPFEFDVDGTLWTGENELLVRVLDPGDDPTRWDGCPFGEIPHGKQSWYGPIGGIWQSVWLELRPAAYISRLRLTPEPETEAIEVLAEPHAVGRGELRGVVTVEVFDPDGELVAEVALGENGRGVVRLPSATVRLWHPDSPNLYTVTATLRDGEQVVDRLSATCGFRTVEARDGRIYLNGEPIYLRGALDQAYYPGTIYTPPSLEFLEDQVRKAKALGLNCLRCHIKIEDPRYYEVADRLGILIWTEIPNWHHLTSEASRRVKETFRGMVERDWNHSSIIAWSLVNEDWGTNLVHNADHRRWLADFYQEAKAIDRTRLIVDNSACSPNVHVASDIEDYHHYRAIPDHAVEWDAWVADFAARADWAWADDYAALRRDDLPLIVSEFGNWGLPHPDRIQEAGREPWWFETGHEWGDGVVYPHGFRQRFDFWQLDRVFGDFDHFIEAHQRHMGRSLAYEIGSMRLHDAIGGYVVTEFTDVHWECNGLLDMARNVKSGLELFVALNQDRAIVVRPLRWSGRPGETLPVEVTAMDVDGPGQEGILAWWLEPVEQASSLSLVEGQNPDLLGASESLRRGRRGDAHSAEVMGSEITTVAEFASSDARPGAAKMRALQAPGGILHIPLPSQPESGLLSVMVRWTAPDGTTLAEGNAELTWTTPSTPQHPLHVADDPDLAEALSLLGYQITQPDPRQSAATRVPFLIARRFTPDLRAAVQDGARLLLLARLEEGERTIWLPSCAVKARAGSVWQGDWATSYSWLRKEGPFAALPGGPLLDMAYARVMPRAVLTGLPAWLMRDRSWAGLALGWLHKPVSLLVTIPYGRGQLTVSTFEITPQTLADDPVAQGLLAGMIELAYIRSTSP